MEGSHGNCYMLADVGSEAKLGGVRALHTCLPEWLLPDSALLDATAYTAQLRPDILVHKRTKSINLVVFIYSSSSCTNVGVVLHRPPSWFASIVALLNEWLNDYASQLLEGG